MMQPAEPILRKDAPRGCGVNSVVGSSLPQPKMRAVFVIVADIFGEQTFQMAFVHRNHVNEQISGQLSTQRSATPFCQGLSKHVRTGLIFRDRTAIGTSRPYFASRSKMRN
jgi:hypothetical protein